MGAGCAGPGVDDVEGEEEAAEGVEPPDGEVVAAEGEDDGKGVEDDVGHGVLREGLHGGVVDEAAPEPAEAFDDYGCRHDYYGKGGELHDGVVWAVEALDGFERHLEEGGYHYYGED